MIECKSGTREDQLRDLTDFVERTRKEIVDIASALGWSIESIASDSDKFLTCPYDPTHRVSKESLEEHLEACQWKAEGYREEDVPLSEPGSTSGSFSLIKFDEELLNKVLRMAKEENPEMRIGSGERLIPRTSDRLLTDFTSDERRAIYEYVVSNTVKPDIGRDIADINKPKSEKSRELTYLELLVQERNLKRRRAKHRGVHTNKKSHTEILREVINQQMEMYTSHLEEAEELEPALVKPTDQRVEEFQEEDTWSKDSKQQEVPLKQSHGHRGQRVYESHRSGDRYSDRSKDRYSPDSRESRRHRKHEHRRRSRSGSRRREEKHRSKHQGHKRKHKSRDRERSESRRNGDRRKDRD